MHMKMVDEILWAMGLPGNEIQRAQTEHRLKLIEFWGIPEGAHVLEAGCGQGDTLAAIAYAVGRHGHVQGIDIASPDDGAPETLGQARERLMKNPLGTRMDIKLGADITNPAVHFEKIFDYAVLSHCLWYFSSFEELNDILKALRKHARHLCIAEWNPAIDLPEQMAHRNAVSIQAVCECFKSGVHSNVRTMFYPSDIMKAVAMAGWTISQTENIYSPDMQDGQWETSAAISIYPSEIEKLDHVPIKLRQLLLSQIEELKQAEDIKPMPVFCLTAAS